jgi:flagellar protein FlbT
LALKLSLKPGEQLLIGSSRVIVVSEATCTIIVEGDAPVLRAEEAIGPEQAVTLLQKLHLCLQQMYLTGDIKAHHDAYFGLTQALLVQQPHLDGWISDINRMLIEGALYRAVKAASKMSKQREAGSPMLFAVS